MSARGHLAMLVPTLVLAARLACAEPPGQLLLPNFDSLTGKSIQSVNITLDSTLLGLAASFLDSSKPDDAATMQVVSGLRGIYVRSYTFNKDFPYPTADVETVRRQLVPPAWQRLVQVHSKEQANVDIYISVDHGRANGLAIISSEPRQFTIVNIVGSIDLKKLHQLEGKFGVPKLQLPDGQ
ncbi:MAG TPA: DUF4252 domain-containing protein [Steroidobacteraceae bacterium]|jgi:hypothetical protein